MTEYYFLNGKMVEAEKAVIPVRTHAFLYGTAVFEGIRAYWNDEEKQLYVFRAPEHYERLLRSAKIMYMQSPYTVEEYCNITINLLKKNNYKQDAYMRPTLYKSAQKVGPGLFDNEDSYMLVSNKMGDYIDTSKGLKVCVSSWRRNSDNAIPPRAKVAGSYANAALIKTDAHNAGFDDAIVLDEAGQVTEGSAMNLFLVQNGKLITTMKTDNILVGITRNTVIELAKDLGIETEERAIDRTELYISDEAFYCGTGAQISPIVSVDNRELGDGKVGPVSKELQKLYFDVVRGKVAKYKHWCMPVY
ncbi:TPA: branched-chain amino acid transaminase [Candidatus Scatousia excrementigallinarum]|uniref:Branched-chain-amino-acid aminotransferase n=1 Tax=Candidatus Scatousia excrementigallinarum TaxID=2840935 RepID=A0A9D1EXE1_9BACT|nr:branched-chain amino acid transaminase [Candidatus Scatousia excrementigallinarum]